MRISDWSSDVCSSDLFTEEKAQEFYSVHKEKPFFGELVSFISSGTVVACILEGNNAVNTVRIMIGSTKSFEAAPGTIRRSEERRVGTECVSTCRSRWSPYN